jgi:hypothetical protein
MATQTRFTPNVQTQNRPPDSRLTPNPDSLRSYHKRHRSLACIPCYRSGHRQNLIGYYIRNCWSRVSSGSIVSDYRLDDREIGVRSRRGQRIFPLACVSRPALRPTQPPVQWVPEVLSPGVKARPGRDADHSPPSSAEVENE